MKFWFGRLFSKEKFCLKMRVPSRTVFAIKFRLQAQGDNELLPV